MVGAFAEEGPVRIIVELALRGLALVAPAALVGCSHVTETAIASEEPVTVPQTPRDVVARVEAAAPQIAAIWSGFWGPDQAYLMQWPEGPVLLVTPGRPPAGYDDAGLAVPGKRRVFASSGPVARPDEIYERDAPLGDRAGIRVFADGRYAGPVELVELMVHEAFHSLQAEGGWYGYANGQFVEPNAIASKARFAAAAEVERRLLSAVLKESSDTGIRAKLRDYLLFRRHVQYTEPSAIVRLEREAERAEGTPTYIEYLASSLVWGTGDEYVREKLQSRLTEKYDGDFISNWIFRRSYGTGGALAYLLQKLDRQWQVQLTQGRFLDEMARKAVGIDRSASLPAPPEALRQWAALEREFTHLDKAASISSVADFMALGEVGFILRVRPELGQDGIPLMEVHSESNFANLGADGVAFADSGLFKLEVPRGSLLVRGLPVLMRTVDGVEEFVVLTGERPADLPTRGCARKDCTLALSGNGYELAMSGPYTIENSGKLLAIELGD